MTDLLASRATGIVVLVPEVFELVDHAHVTLLAPFGQDNEPTPDEISEVERFFADVMPFEFELAGGSTFPGGIRYLSPEPAGPFSRLTHRLHQLFPEYPPYQGRFDLVVPHLTVPADAEVDDTVVHVHAREAVLLHHGEGYSVMARFPFGTSAA